MGDPVQIIELADRVIPLAALFDVASSKQKQSEALRLFDRLLMYRELAVQLRILRSEPLTYEQEILPTSRTKKKVDHAALTREIIARYPKILAALAK